MASPYRQVCARAMRELHTLQRMAALVAGALEHGLVKSAGKLNARVRALGRGVTGLSARLVLRLASAWCDALGVRGRPPGDGAHRHKKQTAVLTAKIVLFASKGGSSREDARIAGAIKVAVKAELKTFVVGAQPPRRDRVRLGRDVPLDDGCCQGVLQHRDHWRLVHG